MNVYIELARKHYRIIILIVITLVLCFLSLSVYDIFSSSFEASIAANQLNDSISEYSIIQKIIIGDAIPILITVFWTVIIFILSMPLIEDVFNRVSKGGAE